MPQIPRVRNEADPNHWPRCEDACNDVTRLYQPSDDDRSCADDRNRRPIERVKRVGIEAKNGEHNGGGAGDRQALVDESGQPADDPGGTRARPTRGETPYPPPPQV